MTRGVRWYLVGSLVLVSLAGCGKTFLQYGEREKWRRDAEVACLQSGTVRESAGLVRISPIEGPGICGADFPLKVSLLGENTALGFADEPLRPPGAIPNGTLRAQQPPWPVATSRPLPPPTQQQPVYVTPRQAQPQYAPPPPNYSPNAPGEPLSIVPPGMTSAPGVPSAPPPVITASPQRYPAPPPGAVDDDDDDVAPPAQQRAAPAYPPPARIAPALGPQRGPPVTATIAPVEVKPVATLACPIVSALDQWIANTVQPSALKWFGAPVAEIKQISAYSCRGMNGNPGAHISEHAFGNALDIAAFVLANGRRITVKDGWHGAPEEQGFLRDVQRGACDQFTTVLAPGSNRYHYDHIHVDLMRRNTGRRICQPGAVDGDLVASRARQNPMVAARQPTAPTRAYDPPFDSRNDPFAWRGDVSRRADPGITGSLGPRTPSAAAAEDNDWVEDDGPRPPIDWSTDRHKPY